MTAESGPDAASGDRSPAHEGFSFTPGTFLPDGLGLPVYQASELIP